MHIRVGVSAAVLLIGSVGCLGTAQRRPVPPPPTAVDHVILAIDSLERGVRLLREATGLTAVFGGVHPGRGTQNALLALGSGQYLELLAPNPADPEGAEAVAEFATYRALTPVGWAARTADAERVRAVAMARGAPGGVVRPGARQRPDGATLRWRTVDPWNGANDTLLPFFIEWDPASPHPSANAPPGCTLVSLTLASPAADSIQALLRQADLTVPVSRAPRDALTVRLRCATGVVEFAPPAP